VNPRHVYRVPLVHMLLQREEKKKNADSVNIEEHGSGV
jgi:hypothetical protein